MLGAVLLQSLPYALTACTRDPVVGVGLQVLSGAGMVVAEVTALLAVQRETPIRCLGGTIALIETTTMLASAVGSAVASALLAAWPVGPALLLLGAGDAVLALLLLPVLLRAVRRTPARRPPARRAAAPADAESSVAVAVRPPAAPPGRFAA